MRAKCLDKGQVEERGLGVPWTWLHGRLGGYIMDPRNPRVPKASFGSLFSSWKTSWQIRQRSVKSWFRKAVFATNSVYTIKIKALKKEKFLLMAFNREEGCGKHPSRPLSGLVLPFYYGLHFSFFLPLQWFQFQKFHECSEKFNMNVKNAEKNPKMKHAICEHDTMIQCWSTLKWPKKPSGHPRFHLLELGIVVQAVLHIRMCPPHWPIRWFLQVWVDGLLDYTIASFINESRELAWETPNQKLPVNSLQRQLENIVLLPISRGSVESHP